jgi:glycosyltransferase involved in cell wall biosynthesis
MSEVTASARPIAQPAAPALPRMKCLWIGRYMPYPLDAGAKVYSAKLAESLAAAGTSVRFLGFGRPDTAPLDCGVDYVPVGSRQRSQSAAIFSRLPIAAAIDSTSAYASLLEQQLCAEWDAIVFDGYGTGWALPRCLAYVRDQPFRRTVLVHISHNHETAVWLAMAREARGSIARRLVLWQNALKVRALERRVVANVDLLSAICEEDLAALQAGLPSDRTITLTPGYAGPVVSERFIGDWTPRRVVVVGSFRWQPKQENLARFVEVADPVFQAHDIRLDIVGDAPSELIARLESRCRATTFHGFVDDMTPFLNQARIAVVPELIGGGFKLKFLDYFFARVPVATLAAAAAGLPAPLHESLLAKPSLEALVESIVTNIDRLDRLNRLQDRAFHVARSLFRWEDRGVRLKHAIARLQEQWTQARHAGESYAPRTG